MNGSCDSEVEVSSCWPNDSLKGMTVEKNKLKKNTECVQSGIDSAICIATAR